MKTTLHKADSRGHVNHGWLNTYHTFSFAEYYDPFRVHFGVLRVLNDDSIAGGMGFGMHPHDNMEIITIPLEGDLAHKDSMGNTEVIKHGDVQVMSAGTGIMHSEFNANKDITCKLLQIWVLPNKQQVNPRYQKVVINTEKLSNNWLQVLSPNPNDEGCWIHQNAWFSLGVWDVDKEFSYALKNKLNGLYIFVINGEIQVENQLLESRDGLGIFETETVLFKTKAQSYILLMEIPMTL